MRNLKKVLLSLGAAAAIAALATGGTFAVFTDQESISGNNIDSGSVEVTLDGDDPVIDVANLVINDTKTGELEVENTGDNKANYVLTGVATSGDSALIGAATIRILDDEDNQVHAAETFSAFNSSSGFVIGDLYPDDTKTYTIEVKLPAQADDDADNALQDKSFTETFTVKATQRAGVNRDTGTPDVAPGP